MGNSSQDNDQNEYNQICNYSNGDQYTGYFLSNQYYS